jgi:hypothetical protein
MVLINISAERCQKHSKSSVCRVESMPFPYLGLPMGNTMPRLEHLVNNMQIIEKSLVGIVDTLYYDVKLSPSKKKARGRVLNLRIQNVTLIVFPGEQLYSVQPVLEQ